MKTLLIVSMCVSMFGCAAEVGKDGRNGTDGTNGVDGKPGKDGEPGKDAPVLHLQNYKVTNTVGLYTLATVDAQCKKGDRLVFGGCLIGAAQDATLTDSEPYYPEGEPIGWACSAWAHTDLQNFTLTATAECEVAE